MVSEPHPNGSSPDGGVDRVFATGRLRDLWPIAVGRSRLKELRGVKVGVLLALWHYSDYETGADARPGALLLASWAQCSEKTARRALKTAEAAGYVQRVTPGGGRGRKKIAATWRLTLPADEVAGLLELAKCRTAMSAQSPDVSAQSPDVSAQSPDVSAQSPDVSAQSPDVSAQSPDVSDPADIMMSGQSVEGASDRADIMLSGQSETDMRLSGHFEELSGHHDVQVPLTPTSQEKKGGSPRARTSLARGESRPSQSGLSELTGRTAGASAGNSGEPVRTCRKHPHWEHSERCGNCADDRKASEAWQEQQQRQQQAIAAVEAERKRSCGRCSGTGIYTEPDETGKEWAHHCSHEAAA